MAMPVSGEAQLIDIMTKSKSRLPKVDISQLLKEVSRRPALWQPHHADFSNRFTRAELWRDVTMRVVPNFHEAKDKIKLVASIASRWKSQRATMLRSMRNKQPFLHEREMSFMVPVLQARIAELKAKHPGPAAEDRGPTLRQRKESIGDFGKRITRQDVTSTSQPPMVPPIRIINRNHTTVGWQRLPMAKPTTQASNRSPPSTGAAANSATTQVTCPPTRYATTIVATSTAKKSTNLPRGVISAAPTSTTGETPSTSADSSTSATAESGATSTAANRISSNPSPVPGEPTVAQELIQPDEAMDTTEEDTDQGPPIDGLITKEEVVDICSETSEDLDTKLLAELTFLNNPGAACGTPPQTVVHAYRGDTASNAAQFGSSPRNGVSVEIEESNDTTPSSSNSGPSGSEPAAAPLRAAARMDSGCPSSSSNSSQEVDDAERRCSDGGTLPLNGAQNRSSSTNPLPGGGSGVGGLVISDLRGSSPMSHPTTTSHNASLDTTMGAPTDPDQAFFDSIKPHMRNWSTDKKLDFQFEVLGLLRNFRSKQ